MKEKVSLTQESPDLSSAENVFRVNIVVTLFLYCLENAAAGKKPQVRWTPIWIITSHSFYLLDE